MSEQERYNNLKREVDVIGRAHDFLYTGKFPGGAAATLYECQMYMKGLYTHMKAECDKMAPLPLPADNTPVESKAEALPVDPVAATEAK